MKRKERKSRGGKENRKEKDNKKKVNEHRPRA